eukprot:11936568-Karenia_brevis.AAC.1
MYVGGNENDRVERKVRASCKNTPWDSKVSFPTSMSHFKKTTILKYRDDPICQVFEDRINPTEWEYMYDCDRMVVFLQERKRN